MKNLKSIIPLLVGICILIISCGDDSDGVSTSAVLGADITANNGDVVEISFSGSSAPEGTEYRLTYAIAAVDRNGSKLPVEDTESNSYNEGDVLLSTTDKSETFSFIPGQNGVYIFQLNVGDSQDQITVTVGGPIVLTTANISSHTTLMDQNGTDRSDLPDYRIADMLTISDLTVSIESHVQIIIDDNAGIIVDNSTLAKSGGSYSEFNGENWKGILVKNSGELNINGLYISKKGNDSFDGYEPAIITVEDGMIGMQGSILDGEQEGSTGIHLLENAIINSDFILASNTLNTDETIRCNVFQSELIVGNTTDYSTAYMTISGMGDTFISTGDGDYSLNPGNMDIYFTGGITMSDFSIIQLKANKGIFFESNTGMVLSQGGRILGSTDSFVKGWNGSGWKGIMIGGNTSSWIRNVLIENAGSSAHSLSGGITSSVYLNGRLDVFEEVSFSNSQSFGVYFANGANIPTGLSHDFNSVSFSNMGDAALAGPADVVTNFLLGSGFNFGDNPDLATVKIKAPISHTETLTFDGLGGDHFYLIEDNLTFNSSSVQLFIRDGAVLKFDNTSIYIGAGTIGQVTIEGTASLPVTLTAYDEEVGWGGVYLGSSYPITYSIDYASFSFGGNTLLTGATDQANLILETTSIFDCTNSTFSNSMGYGVVLESSADFFDFADVVNSNSFSGNTSGDVNDKTN